MPFNPLALEWQNACGIRAYPFTDDSSGVDISGAFILPNSFILEIDLPINAGLDVDPSQFFLYQLLSNSNGFLVTIGYQPTADDSDPIPVATAMVGRPTHVPGTAYALGGIGDYSDTMGKVVVGRLNDIDDQPAGLFTFAIVNARVEPDCVRPIIQGVSAIIVSSGVENSPPLYGDIELVSGENIQLSTVIVDGQNPQIVISAIQGEGTVEDCVCNSGEETEPIYTINGVGPTPTGDFTLLGNTCLDITAITNGLQLADTCSQPCCGCAELEQVTAAMELFGNKAATLEGFIDALQAEVTNMSTVVLGSKLGDQGCTSCD